jgi:hypothetical protein
MLALLERATAASMGGPSPHAAWPATALDTTDACAAAKEVVLNAGAPHRDAIDFGLVSRAALPRCP